MSKLDFFVCVEDNWPVLYKDVKNGIIWHIVSAVNDIVPDFYCPSIKLYSYKVFKTGFFSKNPSRWVSVLFPPPPLT
jgi:hypothetical protein